MYELSGMINSWQLKALRLRLSDMLKFLERKSAEMVTLTVIGLEESRYIFDFLISTLVMKRSHRVTVTAVPP